MLRHNLLFFFRNAKRFKSSFFINLIGLSTGLACTLLIYMWVHDELSFDKFHKNDKQLFQAKLNYHNSDGIATERATPALLAESLAEEMPEVEYAVATTSGIEMPLFLLSSKDKSIKATGQFAAKDFFKMFSYNLIQGDKNDVLRDKNSIVISEKLAKQLFNTTEHVVGKSVEFQHTKQYLISGMFKGTPPNSSDQFDFVLSFEVFKDLMGPGHRNWGNTGPSTFVQLKNGIALNTLNYKIASFIKQKDPASNADVFLRSYSERYLYDKYENGVQTGGRIAYVKLFSIIAMFILIIACINFMNLSTARASQRLKEIGVKKALGARRKTLIAQYFGESILMAFLSLFLALLIAWLFLPQFNEVTGKQLTVYFDTGVAITVLALTLTTGIIAGSYPALYLSGFDPVSVLKGKLSYSAGEVWARKGLVVFQFTLSVIFIIAVVVVYKQIEYVQTKNLGYNKDNIISFGIEGRVKENLVTFLSEMKNIPGIINASSTAHNLMGQKFTTSDLNWTTKNPEDRIVFEVAMVNYDMLQTLNIKMAAGRTFSKEFGADSSKVILNQTAIETMGLKNPIGTIVKIWGQDREIVGVTKDFHFQSFHEAVKPLLFVLAPANTYDIVARIKAGKEQETISRLERFYKAYNPGFLFDYKFLDEAYQAQYAAEKRVAALSKYFSGIAILISCLGLFGLAAFTAERRQKEIGMRKVLGASVAQIVLLLSKDFILLVLIAIGIAFPVALWATNKWLQDFAYKADIQWWLYALAATTAILIALVAVSSQAIKAAIVNPVKSLRTE